ncbi:Sugar phosphate permease [Actinobaculum suis]|uniref:MFS transporter n=1 Tax=Actinobaculum suis TaxID=1657 RepID=A0A1G7DVT5_9ACTO|nr:MFS transporter [Actinobaculum suis]MDY5152889.1 MFS transporter [Actinobaculum suis]SDE55563.1 Sugar phosphate permease [Actinobaculum suis]
MATNKDLDAQSREASVEKSTMNQVAKHLMPFLALMFFINFLDRTAISFAAPHGMNQDLGLTAAQFGFASGIFFIGYIILEVPSNLALHKFGARKWLARIMISWGIVAVLFTFVQSATQLYWLRFLLGVAEAGFFPGAILCLSMWAPACHRARMLGLFYIAQPLTTAIGAPLAGGLIQLHGLFGLEGWRVMFLFVGLPAVVVGIAALYVLKDDPHQARWLTTEQADWLVAELKQEDEQKEETYKVSTRQTFTNGRVWALSLVYFGFIYGLYALGFFLPTIVSGFEAQLGELNNFQEGLITAIPYVVAAVGLWQWSKMVQKRGLKTWHIALPAVIGGISIPAALLVQDQPVACILLVTVTACSIFAVLPNFWTLPTMFLTGAAAAAGTALINTVGNIAGFSAGYITGWLHDLTGGYLLPMCVVGGVMLLSALILGGLRASMKSPEALAAEDEREQAELAKFES